MSSSLALKHQEVVGNSCNIKIRHFAFFLLIDRVATHINEVTVESQRSKNQLTGCRALASGIFAERCRGLAVPIFQERGDTHLLWNKPISANSPMSGDFSCSSVAIFDRGYFEAIGNQYHRRAKFF